MLLGGVTSFLKRSQTFFCGTASSPIMTQRFNIDHEGLSLGFFLGRSYNLN